MALESKPLFHPEVIRQQERAFNLPERVGDWQPKLRHWAELIASGRADDFKETALLPDFLTDIFCGLLGYTGPAGASGVAADVSRRHIPGEQNTPTDVGGYLSRFRTQLEPKAPDEWEPYLQEKREENARLTRALADAEAELNDRVYHLFELTADEIKLLQKEVEH